MLGVKSRPSDSPISASRALPSLALPKIKWRYALGGAPAAAGIGIYLTEPSLISPLLPLAFCLFWLSVAILGASKPNRAVLCLSVFIVASAWIAVPLSLIFDRQLAATLLLAIFTSVLLPLAFISQVASIFYWLIPIWYLQAGVMAWQWFAEGVHRAGGIAENENAGSSFILIGAVFLLNHPRLKWLSVPLLAVLPFSGSRWVLAVGIMVIGLIFLSKHANWRYVSVGIVVAFIMLLAAQHNQLAHAFFNNRGYSSSDSAVTRTAVDAVERARPTAGISLIPAGFVDSHLHSTPIRMAAETGLLSALAWIAASAVCLIQKCKNWRWWCMLATCMLASMYYFMFLSLPFWWLLLNGQKHPSRHLDD